MAEHLPANHAGRLIINISVGSCCAGADPTVPSNNLQVRRTAGPSAKTKSKAACTDIRVGLGPTPTLNIGTVIQDCMGGSETRPCFDVLEATASRSAQVTITLTM